MRKRKLHTYPVVICFMVFIIGVMAFSLKTIPQEYNSKEEKALAQQPMIYDAKSFDGFTDAWDSFVSDQFPGRNEIVAGRQDATLAGSDNSIVGDLFVLDDEYIFCNTTNYQDWNFTQLLKYITAKQGSSGIPFIYTVVPQKNLSLAENERLINEGADLLNLKRLLAELDKNNIPTIDCCKYIMELPIEKRCEFYYKTDYHWNELGAYTASKYMAKCLASEHVIKRTSIPLDSDFVWYDLTGRDYLGDLQKQISNEVTVEEYIPLYEPVDTDGLKYYKDFSDSESSRFDIIASGLDDDVLDYNKVSMYNPAYLRIENEDAPEDLSILILRDSYQCCMTDYLSKIFKEINIVDPRSQYAPSFNEITEARDIDHVILIYHNSNISKELIEYLKAE